MKKLLVLVTLVALAQLATAQVGLKGGVNFGVAEVKDRDIDWENEGIAMGIHAGTFARLNLGSFYLQPEVYYTFSRAELRKNSPEIERLNFSFHRLDVPLLLGYKVNNTLRINAGPFASVNMNARSQNEDTNWNAELNDYYNRTLFGWQAGVGLDLWRFTLDARYETTVGNLREFDFRNSTLHDYLPDEQKQRQFVLSLGYKFGQR
jgi:hypothetical protein